MRRVLALSVYFLVPFAVIVLAGFWNIYYREAAKEYNARHYAYPLRDAYIKHTLLTALRRVTHEHLSLPVNNPLSGALKLLQQRYYAEAMRIIPEGDVERDIWFYHLNYRPYIIPGASSSPIAHAYPGIQNLRKRLLHGQSKSQHVQTVERFRAYSDLLYYEYYYFYKLGLSDHDSSQWLWRVFEESTHFVESTEVERFIDAEPKIFPAYMANVAYETLPRLVKNFPHHFRCEDDLVSAFQKAIQNYQKVLAVYESEKHQSWRQDADLIDEITPLFKKRAKLADEFIAYSQHVNGICQTKVEGH